MDPTIAAFTEDDLKTAGLMDDGVSQPVTEVLETMTQHPELLNLSLFSLECINFNYSGHQKSLLSPALLALSDASTAFSALTTASTATPVAPSVISVWEKTTYYHGISLDPPELLYRSDLQTNPFPVPKGRHPHLPTKTVYGVFNTRLNEVWDDVAPQICQTLKARGIRYSAVKAARFVSHGEDGKNSIGPIVIWIATHPNTTTAKNAHDVSPDILGLLETNGVKEAVVEWYEAAVEKLSRPALLRVTDNTNPTYYLRRTLTAALGMPIATAEREEEDAQGSVAFFFHENKDKRGNPSNKVFAVSNCHVLRKNTTDAYEFKGPGAPRQLVRLAGFRRLQRLLDESKAAIGGLATDAELLAREIVALEAKPESEDPEEAAEDKSGVETRRKMLAKVKKDIGIIEAFYKDVNSRWVDIARRNIGHVAWAPPISVDVEGRRYTRDIGTFEVDAARFKAQFKGNVVDLGAKFTPRQLTNMFYAHSGGNTAFKFPVKRQLKINGCVTRELLANPDCSDSDGEPCLIVMKDGNTSDLTVGRYAGLEAYLCDDLGVESIELAIYNYDKQSGPFSANGDSGSLIFDGNGKMVGILHSGMPKGASKHVTYATPAWWAIEQLKVKYPHADFNRVAF